MEKRHIAILGSTGSIGTQTLDVAKHLGLEVTAITANSNADLLIKQFYDVKPKYIGVTDKEAAKIVRDALSEENAEILRLLYLRYEIE